MGKKGVPEGMVAINVTRDATSFYRSLSLLFYGHERRWKYMKLGSIVSAFVNLESIVTKIKNGKSDDDDGLCKQLKITWCDNAKLIRDDVIEQLYTSALNVNYHAEIFDVYCANIFTKYAINYIIHPSWIKRNGLSPGILNFWSDQENETLNVFGTGMHYITSKLNYVMPLLQSNSFNERRDCWAERHCLSSSATSSEFIICAFCNLQYHKNCVCCPTSSAQKFMWLSSLTYYDG